MCVCVCGLPALCGINIGVSLCGAAYCLLCSHVLWGVMCRCLEFLLQSGATASLKDKQGYSAVHYAAAYGHRHCLELVSHTHDTHMHTHAQASVQTHRHTRR